MKMKVVMDTRSMPMDTTSVRGKLREIIFYMSHFLANWLKIKQTAITEEMVKTVGISPKQLLGIWPSGVNLQDFNKCIPLRVHPGPKEPVRLVYIGVITKERNLENLVDAVILALENGQNVRLDIVGDGEGRETLQKYVSTNGNRRIIVRPPVPPKEIPSVLAEADLGVLPFPDLPKMRVSSFIKIFEYMAAGLPIVATKIVAHTEVLKDKSFVFWADDSSAESMAVAITRACQNKENLANLGKLSRAHASNWTWEASAQKLSNALSKALVE
jgi:glycosyltransferase involved in cell wall biosynthesis